MAEPNTNPDAAVTSQEEISQEIGTLHEKYRTSLQAGGPEETTARLNFPPYRSRELR